MMLCSCNKPTFSFTDLNNNLVVHKCAITKTQYSDIKEDKKLGYVLVESEKVGKPCDFLLKIPLGGVTGKKCPIIPENAMSHEDIRNHNKTVRSFHNDVKITFQRAINIGKFSPMTWEVVGALDYLASNNLLIPPWKQSEETFEEYLHRFKEAEWVDKNWILRLNRYNTWLKRKQKRAEAVEKSVEIFDDWPVLQKSIRKSLKKELKKREKIKSKNVQEQAYQNTKYEQEAQDIDDEPNLFPDLEEEEEMSVASSQASENSEEFSLCDEEDDEGLEPDEGVPGEELEFCDFNE